MLNISLETLLSPAFLRESWFHPKITRMADGRLLMLLQMIHGSDSYGPVMQCFSSNGGHDWSDPEAVISLGWGSASEAGVVEGVCDTVPDQDRATGLTVAVGHNVFYRDGRFLDTCGFWNHSEQNQALKRRGLYSILQADGTWAAKQYFHCEPFSNAESFVCGCSQKVIRPGGEWLIPFYFRRKPEDVYFSVCVFSMHFDGKSFAAIEHGNILEHPHGRGLLEPSLCEYENKVWITVRAEDGYGYHSISEDGANFTSLKPWSFDDGTVLITSSTQQHFARLDGRLWLLYTRNAGYNAAVPRFRAPLFIVEIDTAKEVLIRASEHIALPADGDFQYPESVGFSGNFMPFSLSDKELLVSDSFIRPQRQYQGLTQIARIRIF